MRHYNIPTQQSRRTVDCFPLTRPSPNVAASVDIRDRLERKLLQMSAILLFVGSAGWCRPVLGELRSLILVSPAAASIHHAVLVTPHFAIDAADLSAGKFWEPNGFKRFLDEQTSPFCHYERVAPNEAAGCFRGVRTVRSSSWQGSVGGGSEAPSGRGRKSKLEAEHPGGHVPIKAKFAEFFGKSLTRHSERVWRPSLLEELLIAVATEPTSSPR